MHLCKEKIMRAVMSVYIKKNDVNVVKSAKEDLENVFGLSVSNEGRTVSGLPEDIDEAAKTYGAIARAVENGDVKYA